MESQEQDDISKLKLYSLGIVTKDKEEFSDLIQVSPIESLRTSNDTLSDNTKKYKIDASNAKGTKVKDNIIGGDTITAKWIPFSNSNRITAPDVYKSETVILFKFADSTDEFYWTTIFREPKLRRLEDVMYAFSDLKDGLKPFDKNSSYYLQVSTKNKFIKLHTSKSDGEPYAYDLLLDTRTGLLSIDDNVGNNIKLNSKQGNIELNALNSIKLNSKTIETKGKLLNNGKVVGSPHTHSNGNNGGDTGPVN
jgi:hypothetical protein